MVLAPCILNINKKNINTIFATTLINNLNLYLFCATLTFWTFSQPYIGTICKIFMTTVKTLHGIQILSVVCSLHVCLACISLIVFVNISCFRCLFVFSTHGCCSVSIFHYTCRGYCSLNVSSNIYTVFLL